MRAVLPPAAGLPVVGSDEPMWTEAGSGQGHLLPGVQTARTPTSCSHAPKPAPRVPVP